MFFSLRRGCVCADKTLMESKENVRYKRGRRRRLTKNDSPTIRKQDQVIEQESKRRIDNTKLNCSTDRTK